MLAARWGRSAEVVAPGINWEDAGSNPAGSTM